MIDTAKNELATAVYYETDKAFPSNAVSLESTAENKFQFIAEKISMSKGDVEESPETIAKEVTILDPTLLL